MTIIYNCLEQIHHGVPAVAETDQRNRLLPGRKMMSRGVLSKLNVVESENGTNMAKGLTTKWKALCLIGNCNREKGKRILGLKHKAILGVLRKRRCLVWCL